MASPLGSGQTPGFVARIYQVNQAGTTALVNSISRAEQELAGIIGPNVAELSQAVNGVFPISGVINWSADPTEAGNFQSTSDPSRPDEPVPGIPGTGANTAANTDNIAGEITTYVEFPSPGYYFLGVNSDDGFNVTATDQPPVNNRALVITGGTAAGSYYAASGSDEGGVFAPIRQAITGRLVQVQPADGCTALTNAEELNGNIALIDRGVCAFSIKIQAAKAAGAIAVVMVNNADPGSAAGIWPIVMGGTAVDLPAVMISKPDGTKIKEGLAAGQVTASITPDSTQSLGSFNAGRGASDTIFPIFVEQAGVYPLRTVWFEGGGGANVELFSVTGTGQKVLLNDPENPDALEDIPNSHGCEPASTGRFSKWKPDHHHLDGRWNIGNQTCSHRWNLDQHK